MTELEKCKGQASHQCRACQRRSPFGTLPVPVIVKSVCPQRVWIGKRNDIDGGAA